MRNSNIELLRILSMVLIVMFHFNASAFGLCTLDSSTTFDIPNIYPKLLLHEFGGLGVPIFVAISGWFGMKFKFKKLINLTVDCAFYATLSTVLYFALYNKLLLKEALFFTNNWWFAPAFLCLYIFAEPIDTFLKTTNKYVSLACMVIMCFINCGATFYNLANIGGLYVLVFLYMSARWLKLYGICFINKHVFTLAISEMAFIAICTWMGCMTHKSAFVLLFGVYSSPILIITGVTFVALFSKLEFRSKFVNKLAVGAFSVYLLQESSFGKQFFRPLFDMENFNLPRLLGGACVVYISISVLDMVYKKIKNPIINYIEVKLSNVSGFK